MSLKRFKSITAALALSSAALFSHETKAGEQPTEGANLTYTSITQNGHSTVDFSNTFMGATLAPTDGLDIVTARGFSDELTGLIDSGIISANREMQNQANASDAEESLTSKSDQALVRWHNPTQQAFLLLTSHTSQMGTKASSKAKEKTDFSSMFTFFELRIKTDEQLRNAQDWLLASMNKAGHGAASEALWSLFSATIQSPYLHDLIKEAGRPASYHLTSDQLDQMKQRFDKTGTISAPQNRGRVVAQIDR